MYAFVLCVCAYVRSFEAGPLSEFWFYMDAGIQTPVLMFVKQALLAVETSLKHPRKGVDIDLYRVSCRMVRKNSYIHEEWWVWVSEGSHSYLFLNWVMFVLRFLHFRYLSTVRIVICKYFICLFILSIHSLERIFVKVNILNFGEIKFVIIFFCGSYF